MMLAAPPESPGLEPVPGLTLARAWAAATGLALVGEDRAGTWEVWKPATGASSAKLLGLGATPLEAAHDARLELEGR